MKAILMSIRPQHTCNILNLIKLWEIRKKFPKDYIGWVYIYCTKGKVGLYDNHNNITAYPDKYFLDPFGFDKPPLLNGKVVARFWCDKVEEIDAYNLDKFAKDSCLTINEIEMYLWSNCCCGYAIHITNLEIFDKPKEIYEMKRLKHFGIRNKCEMLVPITSAPQSRCYVEVR